MGELIFGGNNMAKEEDDVFEKIKQIGKSSGVIPIFLREAGMTAPNTIGCYKIYFNDDLKFIGRAEKGLRWFFVCLYNGTLTDKSYIAKKIYKNRLKIKVAWVEVPTKLQCKEIQAELIEKLKPEWNNV